MTIAAGEDGPALLNTANVQPDAGAVDATERAAFMAAAKTPQWDLEKSIRTLA